VTLRSALTAHVERVRREQRIAIEVAWHNARWSAFSPRLESLTDFLRLIDGREEDPEVAWSRMKAWATMYGQTVTEVVSPHHAATES